MSPQSHLKSIGVAIVLCRVALAITYSQSLINQTESTYALKAYREQGSAESYETLDGNSGSQMQLSGFGHNP